MPLPHDVVLSVAMYCPEAVVCMFWCSSRAMRRDIITVLFQTVGHFANCSLCARVFSTIGWCPHCLAPVNSAHLVYSGTPGWGLVEAEELPQILRAQWRAYAAQGPRHRAALSWTEVEELQGSESDDSWDLDADWGDDADGDWWEAMEVPERVFDD